jgi:beta-glucosidase/6-phospho-beta-glucosidase/beta-galactosidase
MARCRGQERFRRRPDVHARRVGKDGDLPPEEGVELTQMGYEFWPEALEQTIRYAVEPARVPVYVTENGVAAEDDTRRVEYIQRALAGVRKCLVRLLLGALVAFATSRAALVAEILALRH